MQESFDHLLGAFWLIDLLLEIKNYVLIVLGFSVVVFFHELGHFLAAKWCDVRVDRFAVGFGRAIAAYRKGLGFVWGPTRERYQRRMEGYLEQKRREDARFRDRTELTDAEVAEAHRELGIGETEYCFNILPLGGYVKMLGQEDFTVDKSGELVVKDDPRAFTHKSVGRRMFIVSAGVIMNLVFASVVFMLVFMIGLEAPAAKIGLVQAESPAFNAGLHVNDDIIKINGKRVSDFNDVMPAVLLADPEEALKITVRRPTGDGGSEVKTFDVLTEHNAEENKLMIGIAPPFSNRVVSVMDDPAIPEDQQLRVGDLIEEIAGRKVKDLFDINQELVRHRGQYADLKVVRKVNGRQETLHLKRRARLGFRSTSATDRYAGHLLGLVPRREVTIVNPGDRADEAGLKPGDVIVRWGQQSAPTRAEILQSIKDNPERDIRVTVLRPVLDGTAKEITIQVRPKASGLFRDGPPRVGMDPDGWESERPIVADIVTKVTDEIPTPAAKLKSVMPRGSLITRVNDEPVKTWSELVDRFIELGGQDVKLSWSYNGQPEQSGVIHVPQALGTTFRLGPGERITKIGDMTSVEEIVDGRPRMQSVENWIGARKVLEKYMGQTIPVEYRYLSDPESKRAMVTVTPEMLDSWVQRIDYMVTDTLLTDLVMTKVQVRNPITAMGIGLQKTWYFIEQVYIMMKRMVITRSVSFDQVSGPVGIVHMGSEVAKQDYTKLLYFLALISANLAVINFLPLPIVDGGLFTFLIIEKIKGSPISLRVMVATQVIGIVLIIGVFLFVTFKDLQKLVG